MISIADVARELDAGLLQHIEIVQAPVDTDDLPPDLRRCVDCGQVKSCRQFSKKPSSRCKACTREVQRVMAARRSNTR